MDVGPPLAAAALDAGIGETTAAAFAGAARCDVQMVDITYRTVAPDGVTPTDASGVVMIPTGAACPGPFPLVAYARGTDADPDLVCGQWCGGFREGLERELLQVLPAR